MKPSVKKLLKLNTADIIYASCLLDLFFLTVVDPEFYIYSISKYSPLGF